MIFGSNELIYVPGSPLPITVEEFEDDEVVDDVVVPTAPPRTKVAKTSSAANLSSQLPAFTLDQTSQVVVDTAPETLPRTRRGKAKPKNDTSTKPNTPLRLYATIPPRTNSSTVSQVDMLCLTLSGG